MTTYIYRQDKSGGAEFDWDAENTRHLKRRRVTRKEFEELIIGGPMYLDYQARNGEERYKVLGATRAGRVLIGVRTPRHGRVRAVTAYTAARVHQDLYW